MVQGEKTVQYTESANNGGKATSDKAAAAAAAAVEVEVVEGVVEVVVEVVEVVVDSWELCVCGKQAGNKDTNWTHSYFLLGFIKER